MRRAISEAVEYGNAPSTLSDPDGFEEQRALHAERAGEGIHVRNEIADRLEAFRVGQTGAHMLGKGGCRDVVRSHEGGVQKIAEAERVAFLEACGIDSSRPHRSSGYRSHLAEIGFVKLRPVEYDHRRGDLCQAGNLQFFVGILRSEYQTGLIVDNDVALGGSAQAGDASNSTICSALRSLSIILTRADYPWRGRVQSELSKAAQ